MSKHASKPQPYKLEEQGRIDALQSLKIMDTAPEESYDRLVRLAIDLFQIPICYIAFLDEKRQWFKSKYGLKQKQTPRNIAFCNETIKKTEPLIITDTYLDKRFANSPLVQHEPFIRFYAGVPLTDPQGYNVGTFCLADTSPKELSEKQIDLLLNLANIAKDQLSLRKANSLLQKIKKQLELRNRFIRKVFSFYMSDDVVKTILESREHQKLGGHESKITVMFSDLRNFTPLSEAIPGEKLVSILNTYFTRMVRVIEKYQGTIDAFIGDAIMIIFGAPHSSGNDSLRAVTCALEMQRELKKLNYSHKKLNLPHLEMGIGINTGVAVVGNIGSKKRMQYSAIGSPVNLSSRIQELSLGGQILISESTYKEVANEIEINGHLRVKVKGIDTPITIFDVSGLIST
ncbi:adenylate/guanylate cyclase domain-containing protein [Legionella micdadei]|uniref:Adenylate cyclase n=1 Tax=Legionella micdadei TaxID=451 RepID=A0A098GFM4_LEGMI|nr:adenylate/guanylate cyclase domain-containing protein [Legionella micdadei]ARG97258.1 adenylate cyclase [Legionella micdadei]ARH00437.1 adenylate cyclase [Legionella micdadei]KTD28134.1 fused adenylate cyclase/two component hybrid sensor/regulator [Legionella micdadei]NSL16764.1 GAF domain-containing protein [Legionella micdadei]CEG61284.1 Adenylate cyclase PLUS two component hybrid sensor and regulator [Legionella micdadei]